MKLTQSQIKAIKQVVNYKGRKVHELEFESGMSLNSYWDGGSRDYFWFVSLNNLHATQVKQNGTPFDGLNLETDKLEPNHVLVQISIFRGKTISMVIYS
jgi:hypothetical protein